MKVTETKKEVCSMKGMVIPTVIDVLDIGPTKIRKKNGILEIKRARENYLNYSIIKIGQNIKKSPGHLRNLAVTPNTLENHKHELV